MLNRGKSDGAIPAPAPKFPLVSARRLAIFVMIATLIICQFGGYGQAATVANCPFCSALNPTFSEQISIKDIIVKAKLIKAADLTDEPGDEIPKATFEISHVVKGKQFVDRGMKFKAFLIGRYKEDTEFLVMGESPPRVLWTNPIVASDRLVKYLNAIQRLPIAGADRLAFFQDYLEDELDSLAFDAYDEFAKAPYADLIALKDRMDRKQLIAWIKNPDTDLNRRRLYLTMLGVCGTKADAEILKKLMTGNENDRRGLDALVASYLSLTKEPGIEFIVDTFFTDPDASYVDTIGAVEALRFHATEDGALAKEKVSAAVSILLDRPKIADLIIADLARWEDWSVVGKLVKMFKTERTDRRWLRVSIASYLIACPKPLAKEYIEELKKIDAGAFQRARLMDFNFDDDLDDSEDEEPASSEGEKIIQPPSNPKQETKPDPLPGNLEQARMTSPVKTYKVAVNDRGEVADGPTGVALQEDRAFRDRLPESGAQQAALQPPGANANATAPVASVTPYLRLKIVLIPLGVSILLLVLLWSVLSGSFLRLIF